MIKDEQFNKFCKRIHLKMSRIYYLSIFLDTFLCNGANESVKVGLNLPSDIYKEYKMGYIADDYFDEKCHKMIKARTFQEPIISFLCNMVSVKTSGCYISTWINIYKSIPLMKICDPADNIWRCLNASKNVIIVG